MRNMRDQKKGRDDLDGLLADVAAVSVDDLLAGLPDLDALLAEVSGGLGGHKEAGERPSLGGSGTQKNAPA